LYQYLGTEAGRYQVDKYLWINAVQQKIAESTEKYFISDDLRFTNEAETVDFHVAITVDNEASKAAYEARKALYPAEYFFNDHESEQEVLPAPHYSIRTDFTTVDVIHLAKTINHKVRSTTVLTQHDLPTAMKDFSDSMSNLSSVIGRRKFI
jgi:hypothetical protein